MTLHIPIDSALERHLASLAARSGDEPAELARRALLKYMEDLEDYAAAAEAWRAREPGQAKSTEDVLRDLGVED